MSERAVIYRAHGDGCPVNGPAGESADCTCRFTFVRETPSGDTITPSIQFPGLADPDRPPLAFTLTRDEHGRWVVSDTLTVTYGDGDKPTDALLDYAHCLVSFSVGTLDDLTAERDQARRERDEARAEAARLEARLALAAAVCDELAATMPRLIAGETTVLSALMAALHAWRAGKERRGE